jgi:hypothetical protein
MPQQHYECPHCDACWLITYKLLDVGAADWPPPCPECGIPMVMAPQEMHTDLKTDGEGGKGFQKFTVHRLGPDGQQHEETIDSLHKLRQIEHDSEQRYRDGEGEPLRFRGYAQNGSNMDVNAFGDAGTIGARTYDSGAQPTKKMPVTRHGKTKPKIKVARHAGASPLKDL